MILTVTLNPSVDQTIYVPGLKAHDTNRVDHIETDAGGKGVNLSRVACVLGMPSVATGFLGGKSGSVVRHVLVEQGVTDAFVHVTGETRTVWSIESGDGPPTTFNSKGEPVKVEHWHELQHRVEKYSKQAAWVALGGSLPSGLTEDAYLKLGHIARKAGAKVLIDADEAALAAALKFGPDLMKPNRSEAERLLGRKLASIEDVKAAALEIRQQVVSSGCSDPIVIISLGEDGAVMAIGDQVKAYDPIKVEAKSTIGSGDSMLAGFLTGLITGKSGDDSMRLALAAGAATAMSDGAHIASKEDVDRLLGSN